jgi:hypothetical protein
VATTETGKPDGLPAIWKPGHGQQESLAKGSFWAPTLQLRSTKLAAIEWAANVRPRLLPGRIGVQVPRQLHGVVQYPPNNE